MATYERIPTRVEVEQFFYDKPPIKGVFYPEKSEDGRTYIGHAWVVTIHEQRVYLQNSDWIMPEPDGLHFYPCRDDVFRKTYRPVAEGGD